MLVLLRNSLLGKSYGTSVSVYVWYVELCTAHSHTYTPTHKNTNCMLDALPLHHTSGCHSNGANSFIFIALIAANDCQNDLNSVLFHVKFHLSFPLLLLHELILERQTVFHLVLCVCCVHCLNKCNLSIASYIKWRNTISISIQCRFL